MSILHKDIFVMVFIHFEKSELSFSHEVVRLPNVYLIFICLSRDWFHIDFGIAETVDFFAISFLKSAGLLEC